MYKNIKDKFLKNRNHMTVKDLTKGEHIEEVNETQLILELIAEKKQQLQAQDNQPQVTEPTIQENITNKLMQEDIPKVDGNVI